jgi:chromosome segregation ATPase
LRSIAEREREIEGHLKAYIDRCKQLEVENIANASQIQSLTEQVSASQAKELKSQGQITELHELLSQRQSEIGKLQLTIRQMQRDHDSRIQEIHEEHGEELAFIDQKVRATICAKDDDIAVLQEQVMGLELRVRELDSIFVDLNKGIKKIF